ncbi:hypothetical protein Ga0466249_002211 [Sporomusaceae bacterium BoRhaA]|nr:hypothetical protein [Pelorhabdus rhamnosifermentans]
MQALLQAIDQGKYGVVFLIIIVIFLGAQVVGEVKRWK